MLEARLSTVYQLPGQGKDQLIEDKHCSESWGGAVVLHKASSSWRGLLGDFCKSLVRMSRAGECC
jgi:hypothetical protein